MDMQTLVLASAEIFLLTMICVVLVVDLFVTDQNRTITFSLSLASLVGTGFLVLSNTPEMTQYLFDGSDVNDPLAGLLKIASIVMVGIGFIYSRSYLIQSKLMKGEFFLLSLFLKNCLCFYPLSPVWQPQMQHEFHVLTVILSLLSL